MAEDSSFVEFMHQAEFDVSKLDDYSFDKHYQGPIFTTRHRETEYKWRVFIIPNGKAYDFRIKLNNNESSEWEDDLNNVRYYLQFLEGPLSSVNVGFSLKVKPSSKTAAVLHHFSCVNVPVSFDLNDYDSNGGTIATKEELERDGSLEGGLMSVIAEIKMSSDLFDQDKILVSQDKILKSSKTTEGRNFFEFTNKAKFAAAKFHEYPYGKHYFGPIFSTSRKGIEYHWCISISPNGSPIRNKLDSGEWSEWKEERTNVVYHLAFLKGPLSAVTVGFSLEVKPSNNTATVLHHHDYMENSTIFNFEEDDDLPGETWSESIATKKQLERDGSLEGGFLTVVSKIKMSTELFNPDYILGKMKEKVKHEEEITPVPYAFFDMIDKECNISLKVVVGDAKKPFFCIQQVLEKNSAYFRHLMHSNDFNESKDSKLEYLDQDPEGVRTALRYIYLKKLPQNFKELAQVCLPAAHLFLLPGLVLECERVLIGDLSAENDVDMVVLAITYDLKLLKIMAMNSIAVHFDDVIADLTKKEKLKNVDVLMELLEKMFPL